MALHLSVVYAHPQWIIKRYLERFGEEQTELLLAANNHRPMLTLRVNTLATTVEAVIAQLEAAEIKYERCPFHKNSIQITSLRDVRSLPLFADGLISVQDASASLATILANPSPGMNVVDLCAAPGGKATYTAELMQNKGSVIALELYESKLRFIDDNAKRAGISIIQAVHGDAREYVPTGVVDMVLVDAPCTGLGTVAKKPDIKWRRDLDSVRHMSEIQKQILRHAAEIVKPGGVVVYSTCSIEREENANVIQWFLEHHPNFSLDRAENYLPTEVCYDGFLQTFPHIHKTDGAFGARLIRND